MLCQCILIKWEKISSDIKKQIQKFRFLCNLDGYEGIAQKIVCRSSESSWKTTDTDVKGAWEEFEI